MANSPPGTKVLVSAFALALLGACAESEMPETPATPVAPQDTAAEDNPAPLPDFTALWAAETRYVLEGIAAGVPLQLYSTDWAPLSDGVPEEIQAPTFEEQRARIEQVIASNVDIFAQRARSPYQPPYSEAGLAALEEMQTSQTPSQNPYEMCLPSNATGFGGVFATAFATSRMVHKDDLLVAIAQDETVRHIYLDGRDSSNALPAYEGHSVGEFDSDGTLVVVTTAYLGTTFNGWPMSSEARLVETLSLSEDGNELTIKSLYEDPVYLAEPVARMTYMFRQPDDFELTFDRCVENVYGAQVHDEIVPDYVNERRELQEED